MNRASATKAPSAIIKDATALDAQKQQPNLHIVRPPEEGQGEEERILPLDCIGVSPYQPRRHFDPDALQRLADSLKGRQLQPIVVRPIADVQAKAREAKLRYELIDGERRWRASKLAKLSGIRAMIVHCTDAQACEWAGIANLEREDLNAIERAHWMRSMLDVAGYTQQKLADRLQATQGHVSNMVRLLDLPEAIQAWIISGEMPASWARLWAAWAHRPTVMALCAKCRPNNEHHLKHILYDALEKATRGLDNAAFRPTPAQLKELDVVSVRLNDWMARQERRCFNVELYDRLQTEALARQAERQAKRAEKAGKAIDLNGDGRGDQAAAKLAKERAKQQAQQFARRLYRWKITWLQTLLFDKLTASPDADAMILRLLMHFTMQRRDQRDAPAMRKAITDAGGQAKVTSTYGHTVCTIPSLLTVPTNKLRSVALDLLSKWLVMPTDAAGSHLNPSDIEDLADALGIVVKRDWKLTEEYLQLHTTAQLIAICKDDWDITVDPVGMTRGLLIREILKRSPKACPAEVLKTRRPK